jgi:hypothetical protein
MKDGFLKIIQKFLNTPFQYVDLLAMLDKQKDFLMDENILNKTEEREYNSLWDTVICLEKYFEYAKDSCFVIYSKVSVKGVFDSNYNSRPLKPNAQP